MEALYYYWGENTSVDIEETFQIFDIKYEKTTSQISDYTSDTATLRSIQALIDVHAFDFIFSFNYFPFLSILAERNTIPYVSWVYDCPHLTLYSKTVSSAFNYLFIFDLGLCNAVSRSGAQNVYHLPLAVNSLRLKKTCEIRSDVAYKHDVSFVGSLYENNFFDQITYLPEYLKGYFTAIMEAQQKIWGCNLIEELLTEEILSQINPYVQFPVEEDYFFSDKILLTDFINQKITSMERIKLLSAIADRYKVDLFSASNGKLCPSCNSRGTISYTDQMPLVFNGSKINLNISLRSITSGIPLRCMDIFGAGGFLLTNYQPELAQFFVPKEDFVYFENDEDCLNQVAYYLEHDKERIEIAQNGFEKVHALFSYQKQFEFILSVITGH